MDTITIIVAAVSVAALCVAFFVGYFVPAKKVKKIEAERQKKFNEIVDNARKKAKDIQYRARQEAKQVLKDEQRGLQEKFDQQQRSIRDKESNLQKRARNIEQGEQRVRREEQSIQDAKMAIENTKEKYEEKRKEIVQELERVAQVTRDQAKEMLLKQVEEDASIDKAKALARVEEETKEEAEKRAKRIIGISIQRFAGEYVAERTISSVELPSDDIKGRLIGREGRNIRAFEQICGVDLIIDDTPGTVVISCFNVVRRQIARETIKRLIDDGRIHPARIEEFYEKSKKRV